MKKNISISIISIIAIIAIVITVISIAFTVNAEIIMEGDGLTISQEKPSEGGQLTIVDYDSGKTIGEIESPGVFLGTTWGSLIFRRENELLGVFGLRAEANLISLAKGVSKVILLDYPYSFDENGILLLMENGEISVLHEDGSLTPPAVEGGEFSQLPW